MSNYDSILIPDPQLASNRVLHNQTRALALVLKNIVHIQDPRLVEILKAEIAKLDLCQGSNV